MHGRGLAPRDRVEPRALAGAVPRRRRAGEGRRRRARRRRATPSSRGWSGRHPLRATWGARRGGRAGGRRRSSLAGRRSCPGPRSPRRCCSRRGAASRSGGCATRRTRAAAASARARRRRSSVRTAVRAGFLAVLAALAAVGGESWTSVFDDPAAVAVTVAAGVALAWLSPELPGSGTRRRPRRRPRRARRCEPQPAPRLARAQRRPAAPQRAVAARAAVRLRGRADRALGRGLLAAALLPGRLRGRAGDRGVRGQPRPAAEPEPRRVRRRGRAAGPRPARRAVIRRREPAPARALRARAARPRPGRAGERRGAREARAHGAGRGSRPRSGSPTSVTFYFNEPVEASFGVIRVFDAGRRRGAGGLAVPAARARATRSRSRCSRTCPRARTRRPTGSSRPTRIPVSGGVVFSIGTPSGRAERRRCRAQAGRARVTDDRLLGRPLLGYAAIAIAVGALFFLAFAWRPAAGRPVPTAATSRWAAASAAFDRRLPADLGRRDRRRRAREPRSRCRSRPRRPPGTSIWDGLHADVLDGSSHTRFGSLMIVRAVAWAAARRDPRRRRRARMPARGDGCARRRQPRS